MYSIFEIKYSNILSQISLKQKSRNNNKIIISKEVITL